MTTQEQIDKAKDLAQKINQIEGVKEAYVDDWGRHGNFSLVIVREKYRNNDQYSVLSKINFRNIIPTAKKLAREAGFIWRSNELYLANKYVNMVDIDYQPYDPVSNRFQEQVENPDKYGEDGLPKLDV